MQSSSRSLSLAQLCLLAAFLAGLIYYLETERVAVEKNVPFLGGPLRPASGKMHILVTGLLPTQTMQHSPVIPTAGRSEIVSNLKFLKIIGMLQAEQGTSGLTPPSTCWRLATPSQSLTTCPGETLVP